MKISLKTGIMLAACLLAISSEAITLAKEKDVMLLLRLMGNSSIAEEMANSVVSMTIAAEKRRYPDLPKNVEYAVSEAIYDTVMEYAPELDALVVPLYDKYYTHEETEIRDLIAFFETQTGRKYASVLVPMMQDMMPVAEAWAQKRIPVAVRRVEVELLTF